MGKKKTVEQPPSHRNTKSPRREWHLFTAEESRNISDETCFPDVQYLSGCVRKHFSLME